MTNFVDKRRWLRRQIDLQVEDAAGLRPACTLLHDILVDDEGRIWLRFWCVEHKSTWRELAAVVDDSGNVRNADVSLDVGTPCGVPARAKTKPVDKRSEGSAEGGDTRSTIDDEAQTPK